MRPAIAERSETIRERGRIVAIDLIADPARLDEPELELLNEEG
jgi:hypothetical protein